MVTDRHGGGKWVIERVQESKVRDSEGTKRPIDIELVGRDARCNGRW